MNIMRRDDGGGEQESVLLSRMDGPLDGGDDLVVRRFLPSDQIAVHPHGELTTIADDERRGDAERLIDERRHTGRARVVVSDLAVANLNLRHDRAFTS